MNYPLIIRMSLFLRKTTVSSPRGCGQLLDERSGRLGEGPKVSISKGCKLLFRLPEVALSSPSSSVTFKKILISFHGPEGIT